MTWKFLLSYLKVLEKSGTLPFTVSWYLFSFQSYKGLKIGKLIEKWYRGLGKNQAKFIKSVASRDGHLARVNLSMYYSSVNTCQNQAKLSTLKVQDDVQLSIAMFCLSIKGCRSKASFNDFTIKGLGAKILAWGPKSLDCNEKLCFVFWFQNSNWFWRVIAKLCFIS